MAVSERELIFSSYDKNYGHSNTTRRKDHQLASHWPFSFTIMAMSELKLIVDQAVEEMGGWNDAAIDRWSELSGVDVRAINDTTPFDIDVANRLLATFPQVLKEMMAGPAPLPPEEPTPEEVITELSEMAEGISEALDMTPEETKALEVTIPEVDLEPGLTEGAPRCRMRFRSKRNPRSQNPPP